MGVDENHRQVPAPLPTAPPVHHAIPVASDTARPPVAGSGRCCNRRVCKFVYHIIFSIMVLAAIVFLFIGIFVDWSFFVLIGIDAILAGILWSTYCCVYGCCCGPYGVSQTAAPASYPVTIQMQAPGPPPGNAHFEQQGYPVVHQQLPQQPAPYGTTPQFANQPTGPAGYGHNVAYQP